MEGAHLVSAPVLDARGITLRRGTREILRGVYLRVNRGELVALMGLSGGGKTTFLRAVAGLDTFDAGTLSVDGVSLQAGGSSPLSFASRATSPFIQFATFFAASGEAP